MVNLSAKQEDVILSNKFRNMLIGKPRSGKSVAAAGLMISQILSEDWPELGSEFNGFMVYSNTSPQARDIGYTAIKFVCDKLFDPPVPVYIPKVGPLILNNHWPIYTKGLGDNNSEKDLLGKTYGTCWYTEITELNKTAFEYALSRQTPPNAIEIYDTNTRHSGHWVKKELLPQFYADPEECAVWYFNYQDNPSLTKRYVKKLRASMSKTQLMRLDRNLWYNDEDAVFEQDDIDRNLISISDLPKTMRYSLLVLDPAKTYSENSDNTGFALAGLDQETIYQIHSERHRKDLGGILEIVRGICAGSAGYIPNAIGVENNGGIGQHLIDAIRMDENITIQVYPIIAKAKKSPRAQMLVPVLRRDEWKIVKESNEALLDELYDFNGEDGMKDDTVDAAVHAARELLVNYSNINIESYDLEEDEYHYA